MILGLDTSTDELSLAVKDQDNNLLFAIQDKQGRRHGEVLVPTIAGLFANHGLSIRALTGIAVGLGPGSFTGVRVGVATALGLAQSLGLPIMGISSYKVVAAAIEAKKILVVGDARRDSFYAAGYEYGRDGLVPFHRESLVDLKTLTKVAASDPMVLSGPDASRVYALLQNDCPDLSLAPAGRHWPQASHLINLARPGLATGGVPYTDIDPLYLRKTQAEEMRERHF